MPVITIRGQYGSWANEVGKLTARKLDIDYVDREIIAEVAERLRRPRESVAEKEKPPSTFFGRVVEALAKAPPMDNGIYAPIYLPAWEMPLGDTKYLAALERVIRELAGSQAIVIRGRGSQFILKDFPGAFHVLTVAPAEVRLKRIMEQLKLDEEGARKEIDRFDNGAREFVKRYFQEDIMDPMNYDVVINTNHLSIEEAAKIIAGAVPLPKD